ncbi:MAG: murein hydrolase activator EnvC family protein, partial [Fibrobacterota bacterium]
ELSVRLSDIQAVISEKESEKSLLVSQREEKNSILEKVHEQKSEYNIMVRALEREYRKLNKILASLELKRKRAKKADFGDFSRMKGVLQWPVKGGDVIKKYGKNVHPEFRTATFNPGIDIKTTRGHSVRAVFDGSVVYTGHLRGMGNFIILDHGNGYYTMYGNLDKVLVKDKDRIKSGTPVGLAGDSGSFDGVKLHFEIRHKKTTLDPESWLGT